MHVIVVADHAYVTGGQSKVAIESALGLVARGHRVTFFAAAGPVDPRLTDSSIAVVCLNQGDINTASKPAFLVQTLWNRKAAHEFKRLLAASDPDNTMVHVHAWAKALSPSIGPVLAHCDRARVYTMHEFFMACPNGGFYHYPRAELCHRTPMSLSCVTTNCDSQSYARKVVRLGRQVLVDAGGLSRAFPDVITISQLQEDVLRPHMPAGLRWHRVDNPIDVTHKPATVKTGKDFVYVGRLSPEKGVALFCDAAERNGFPAVVVGDGPLRDSLQAAYPGVRFAGWKTPDDIRAILHAARALVFPSVWYEGQPLTIYEALAMGTPAIVSDVCAGREAVVPGENGLLFRSGDVESLSAAIRHVTDEGEAARMSQRASDIYWAKPLSLDRHLDTIEGLYRSILAQRGAPVMAPTSQGFAAAVVQGN